MNKETSLYLDMIRFLAAIAVFLGHASNQYISGGYFWQIYPYLQTAVMVFFVLSGFVIAHVVATRENDPKLYSISRITRIYSIALPALALTIILDAVGMSINPASYADHVPTVTETQPVNYILSLAYLQNVWNLKLNPGTNGPFWSLSYEVAYYALFGVIYFCRSKTAIIPTLIICLVVGPSILSLFPIWLMGYGCYQLNQKKRIPFERFGIFIFLLSTAGLFLLSPVIRSDYTLNVHPNLLRKEVIADYFDGILFTVNILYFRSVSDKLALLRHFETQIRWLSALTFTIYLMHYPIIRFITATTPLPSESSLRLYLLYGMTPFILIIISLFLEKQHKLLKKRLLLSSQNN
jgi:peptidoglycan/LPS O-acetylase OafA/YrhL